VQTDQQVTATAEGNNDGILTGVSWSVDDPDLLDLTPDGPTCLLRGKGVPGTARVTVRGVNSAGAPVSGVVEVVLSSPPPLPPANEVTVSLGEPGPIS
jgi:hypothetical protein